MCMYRRVFLLSYKMHERHRGCESESAGMGGWMCAKPFVLMHYILGDVTPMMGEKNQPYLRCNV